MHKLFLAIYFIVAGVSFSAQAKTIEISDISETKQPPRPINLSAPDGLPNPENLDEVVEFFRNRFKNASVSTEEEIGDLNKVNSIDVQHSAEYIEQMKEDNKSVFEKIYDQAMQRINNSAGSSNLSSETIFYEEAAQKTSAQEQSGEPSVAVVNVQLPTGQRIIAPAREHIPYLLSSFNILPTGLIQVQEDITVVANGQKLKNGLIKKLPKYSISRSKVKKKLDIQLESVTINGENIPYVLEEIGDDIFMKPRNEYILKPGVYTYTFKYFLDRKLWYYDDFTEFYTDVSGSYLNLLITSANAIVSVPDGKTFLGQNVFVGHRNRLSARRGVVASLDGNALGFASVTPLLPGEGMHILVSLDNSVFLEPDFSRSFVWFVTDYGDILFAVAGLAAVLISYMLSWNYIRRNKSSINVSFKRTAPMLRLLEKGVFDTLAFVGGLLELFRKNIIDIQKQDNSLVIIKKTDNLSSLSRAEKKAVNAMFVGKDAVLDVTSSNVLKFKRAFTSLEKSTNSALKRSSLQLNSLYLFFSVMMLLLVEVAIAWLAVNPAQTGLLLVSCTATIAFYMWVMKRKFNQKWLTYAVKIVGGLFIVLAVLLMSIYIKFISVLSLVGIVYAIFEYSALFSKRNDFMKNKAKEIAELKSYLENNALTIGRSSEFSRQQANIFVLGLADLYPNNNLIERGYRLNIASELLKALGN